MRLLHKLVNAMSAVDEFERAGCTPQKYMNVVDSQSRLTTGPHRRGAICS